MRARTAPRQRAPGPSCCRLAARPPASGGRLVGNDGLGRTAGAGKPPRPQRLPGRKLGPVRAAQVRRGRRSAPAPPRPPAHPAAQRRRRPARGRSRRRVCLEGQKLERCGQSHGTAASCSWTASAPGSRERDVFEPSPNLRRPRTIGLPENPSRAHCNGTRSKPHFKIHARSPMNRCAPRSVIPPPSQGGALVARELSGVCQPGNAGPVP